MRTFFSLYCTFILLLSGSIFAGDEGRPPFPMRDKGFFVECHLSKNAGVEEAIAAYRLQNSVLLFSKEGDTYVASYSIQVQVLDSLDKVLGTEIVDKKLSVKKYEETNSDAATQGMIKIACKAIHPRLSITLSDNSTNREVWHREFPLEKGEPSGQRLLFTAVVESFKDTSCTSGVLQNFGGSIPFSEKSSDIIISIPRSTTDSLKIRFKGQDTTYTFISSLKKERAYGIDSAQNALIVTGFADTSVSSFIFKNISQRMLPGRYEMSIGDDTLHGHHQVMVAWIDMPRSLQNQELAYNLLELVDTLYADSPVFDKYSKKEIISIFKFWEKYDPTPATTFNERMSAFYRRADFAIEKFSSIKGGDGATTGRGSVFIKFGTPSTVERTVTKGGKMAEIWKYTQLKKEFYFVDYTGSGNYELVNSL